MSCPTYGFLFLFLVLNNGIYKTINCEFFGLDIRLQTKFASSL